MPRRGRARPTPAATRRRAARAPAPSAAERTPFALRPRSRAPPGPPVPPAGSVRAGRSSPRGRRSGDTRAPPRGRRTRPRPATCGAETSAAVRPPPPTGSGSAAEARVPARPGSRSPAAYARRPPHRPAVPPRSQPPSPRRTCRPRATPATSPAPPQRDLVVSRHAAPPLSGVTGRSSRSTAAAGIRSGPVAPIRSTSSSPRWTRRYTVNRDCRTVSPPPSRSADPRPVRSRSSISERYTWPRSDKPFGVSAWTPSGVDSKALRRQRLCPRVRGEGHPPPRRRHRGPF